MKEGPDLARIAALIGEPARANILTALMAGRALTVTELAAEAGVTVQTASGHLARLEEGGLVVPRRSGRHKYFALRGGEVARVLEALLGLAAALGHLRSRPGPRDPSLRAARVCYDHMAGEAGIRLYDSLLARGFLGPAPEGLALTDAGATFVTSFGIDLAALRAGRRRVLCRDCLDWSERRSHLAGALGRAMLDHMLGLAWLHRVEGSRALRFTPAGRRAFDAAFPPVEDWFPEGSTPQAA